MNKRAQNELIIACNNAHQITQTAISEDLQRALRDVSNEVRVYATKSRFKNVNSVMNKVQRKRRDDAAKAKSADAHVTPTKKAPPYSPYSVTDVWGFRFVTLFQSDIPPVVRALLARLDKFNEENRAFPVRMKEFVVYTSRPANDPLSIVSETEIVVKGSAFGQSRNSAVDIRPAESRESAYSSVHFIFERDCEIQLPGEKDGERTATFEIQIRDIFEEGWGEIQHLLLYSDKDNIDDEDDGNVGKELWRPHLNALKTFVDGCSQHASIIRQTKMREVQDELPSIEPLSVTSRTEDRDSIVHALRLHGASGDAQKAVVNAYASLLVADSLIHTPVDAARAYEKADKDFKTAIERVSALPPRKARHERSILYFLQMEQANSLFNQSESLSRDLEQMTKKKRTTLYENASAIYDKIRQTEPHDPVVAWRQARTLTRIDGSTSNLEKALELLDVAAQYVKTDPLTGSEHWLTISISLQKSVVCWLLSKELAEQDKLAYVEAALAASKEAQAEWNKQPEDIRNVSENAQGAHKAASNCLYFAAALIKMRVDSPENYTDFIRSQIEFVEKLPIEHYQEYYKTRDNLMHAYEALGELDTVFRLATLTFNELRANAEGRAKRPLLKIDEIRNHLVHSEQSSYDAATAIVSQIRDSDA